MREKIFDILEISHDAEFEFKEIYGFTFVFKKNILNVRGEVASAEIKPVGIIYEENGEYYFAPLDEAVKIEPIIKEYIDEM